MFMYCFFKDDCIVLQMFRFKIPTYEKTIELIYVEMVKKCAAQKKCYIVFYVHTHLK